jgi:hypothetical protein
VKGYPITTISRGTVLVQNCKLVAEAGHGRFLKRKRFEVF